MWSRASLFIDPFSRSFGGVGGEGFDVTLVTDMDNAGTVNLELVEMNDAKREWGKVGVNRTNQNVLAPTRIHGYTDIFDGNAPTGKKRERDVSQEPFNQFYAFGKESIILTYVKRVVICGKTVNDGLIGGRLLFDNPIWFAILWDWLRYRRAND